MTPRRRNLWIWAGCVGVALALWGLVARVRMHLVDEPLFLACVVLAALVLTALYWWDVAAGDGANDSPNNDSREDS